MRIVAGRLGSRRLSAPSGEATRPTSDRLRETLFNVLAPRIEGGTFLDLYAGSGAVGIEALSRGAADVVFVERAPAALKALRTNLSRLGITGGFRIYPGSVAAYLRRVADPGAGRFDLIFLDPPYNAADEYAATLCLLGSGAARLLAPGGQVVAEHRRKQPLEPRYNGLHRVRLLEQGDAALAFFASEEPGKP